MSRSPKLLGLAVAILCGTWPVQAADTWYFIAPPFSSFADPSGTGDIRVLYDAPLDRKSVV